MAACVIDWSAAYIQHAPELVRYLRRFTVEDAAAQDLLQDCFVRAMRAHRQPTSSEELGPWLIRIASNLGIDALRRSRRRPVVPLRAGEGIAVRSPAADAEQIRQVLRALPREQAAALVLRLHYGYLPAEIAVIVGASQGAVKSRLARARMNFVTKFRELDRG